MIDTASTEPHRGLQEVVSSICWSFMGLGVYRAWIEMCFVGSFVPFPADFGKRSLFDLACLLTLLACVAASRSLSPVLDRRWVRRASVCGMTLASAMAFATLWLPDVAGLLSLPASVLGGVGVGFIILLWSELYGCLNPIRIALYYALSQLVGAAIIWTFKGFAYPWLAVYTCLLPIVSLGMLLAGLRTLPPERRPRQVLARFSFPWKPAAFVSVYAFAFGLQEASTYSVTGPHSGPGMIVAALVVAVGILMLSRWVDFGTIYAVWIPVMMMAGLLLSLVAPFGNVARSFFISLSYGAAEVFMMTMIGSIAYRYGANAVWLFGIERAVRLLSVEAGLFAHGQMASRFSDTVGSIIFSAVVAVMVAVATVLFLSEKRLNTPWGSVLKEAGKEDDPLARLGLKVSEVTASYGLTGRESEILFLLAQGKKPAQIENQLYVASSTVKTHVKHIYQKLGIHSRDEMLELLGMEGELGVVATAG